MTRAKAIEIINQSRADIGDMDAAVAFSDMTDGEVIEEARAIMIESVKGVARYCGTELTDEEAREEWMATEAANDGEEG